MRKYWIFVPNTFGVKEWRQCHSYTELKLAKKMGYLVAVGFMVYK